jgi:hypothetical protein
VDEGEQSTPFCRFVLRAQTDVQSGNVMQDGDLIYLSVWPDPSDTVF